MDEHDGQTASHSGLQTHLSVMAEEEAFTKSA